MVLDVAIGRDLGVYMKVSICQIVFCYYVGLYYFVYRRLLVYALTFLVDRYRNGGLLRVLGRYNILTSRFLLFYFYWSIVDVLNFYGLFRLYFYGFALENVAYYQGFFVEKRVGVYLSVFDVFD